MTIPQGTQFGPYRILDPIGSGGMGDVYRAQDTRLGREVAIKLVSDRYLAEAFGSGSTSAGTSAGTLGSIGTTATALGTLSHRRFMREAQSASSLNHPNICTIYDIGEQAGGPYLVMELLRGETLKEALWRGPLSATDVVAYSRQAAAALAAAHAQGIIHRDIKPANIFVHEGARGVKQVKILDFGLAKRQGDLPDATAFTSLAPGGGAVPADLTVAGVTPGTALYMSPEQAKGEPLDARTDLFSLGVVMYEMATGTKPFGPLVTKEPGPVSAVNRAMPAELDFIVAKLLAKEKEQRYQTAEQVLQDLETLAAQLSPWPGGSATASGIHTPPSGIHTPIPIQPHPVAQDLPSAAKGRRIPLLLAAAVIVLLAGAFAWWKHRPAVTPGIATGPATGRAAAPVPATKNAIIVADFVNQTGDPVFQTTLNQALAVQLGQSPVLDIVSSQHLRQSLQYLGKKPDDAITPAIAREIGQREAIKAILTGTIARLGGDYIITLSAQKTATGDQIASVQTQASGEEKVLDALNEAAAQMRARLGESLDSIQKLNAPFGQATTPSLEAFRAYALGDEAHTRDSDIPEAEDHYRRSLALDPKLAMAWARLGVIYLNSGQTGRAMEYFTKAHELSGNVSERERLYIEGHYYATVLGDLDKAVETLQVAVQEYPLEIDNYVNLGDLYEGETPEKAEQVLLKGLAMHPEEAMALTNAVLVYTSMDQFDKARNYIARAGELGINGTDLLGDDMSLYGASGDTAALQRILAEGAGRPDQFQLTGKWGNIQAQWGQFHAAAATLQQAAGQAGDARAPDARALFLLNAAYIGWPAEQCQNPQAAVKQALAVDQSKATQIAVAATRAFCGEGKPALPALDVLEKKYSDDTLVQQVCVPQARAYIALEAGEARKALELLAKGQAFDQSSPGPYLRGLAYLQSHDAGNAIAAFKIATKYKGASFTNANNIAFPLNSYALGLLGLGRAYAMAGDKANAKAAYDRFFAEWKNADPELAVMAQAKREYAGL